MGSALRPPPPDFQASGDERPPPPDFQPMGEDAALTQPPIPAQPQQENWLVKNYRDYVAEPVTKYVAGAPRYDVGDLDVRNPGAGQITESPMMSPETAKAVVPQTPAGGLAAIASLRAGPLGFLANILYPAAGAAVGSAASGNSATDVLKDAGTYGAGGLVGKGVTEIGSKLIRSVPWAKDLINERNARNFAGRMGQVDPAVGEAIAAQETSPFLKGGTTTAQLRQAATGLDIQRAASNTMDGAIQQIDAMSGNPALRGANLDEAYAMLEPVVQRRVVGPVGANGYTLQQAQSIRSSIGGRAFSQAARERGIDDTALISLRNDLTTEIESFLAPDAVPLWRQANQRYGGTQVADEFLNATNATQGLPNRMFLNRNALSAFLDQNRGDLIRRMGREEFDAVVREVLGDAQPGTRDILTSGAGTPLSAFMQTFGRGTNSGSANYLGVPLRTLLPNLGSESTGRAPFTPDSGVQALMNLLGQRSAEQFRAAQQGTPVKIGPIP